MNKSPPSLIRDAFVPCQKDQRLVFESPMQPPGHHPPMGLAEPSLCCNPAAMCVLRRRPPILAAPAVWRTAVPRGTSRGTNYDCQSRSNNLGASTWRGATSRTLPPPSPSSLRGPQYAARGCFTSHDVDSRDRYEKPAPPEPLPLLLGMQASTITSLPRQERPNRTGPGTIPINVEYVASYAFYAHHNLRLHGGYVTDAI